MATLGGAGGPLAAQAPNAADVAFVTGMIPHHAQALRMAALVPARSKDEALRALAQRITISQRDEIALLAAWLRARQLPVPETSAMPAGHAKHDMAMPGMLSEAALAALAAASGRAFDTLFLAGMIRHHEGALAMVATVNGGGGALDPETFRFASDVDADQRAEIARMQRLLVERRAAPTASRSRARPPQGAPTTTP